MKSFFIFILFLFVAACSSVKVGDRDVVQTSSDKPDWLSDNSKIFERTETHLVFEATKLSRENLDIARDEVEAALRLDVGERLSTEISGQIWNNYAAKNREGGMIEEEVAGAVKSTVSKLTIIGFSLTDLYWEKFEVQEDYGVGYVYDVYGRGDISLSEYNKLYKKALQNLAGNDREDLKNSAEEILNSL